MNCELVQEQIHAYMDGELSADRSKAVRYHLERCSDCMDKIIDYHQMDQRLTTPEAPKAPDGFTDEVMNTVDNEPHTSFSAELAGFLSTLLVGIMIGLPMALSVNSTAPTFRVTDSLEPELTSDSAVLFSDNNSNIEGLVRTDNQSIGERLVTAETGSAEPAQATSP